MSSRVRDAEKKRLAEELRILGTSLSDLREKAGLSIRAMARRLDVSPTFVVRIEKGLIKRKPSAEQLSRLAQVLGDIADEYGDEFRRAAGIVPPETQEILAKSQAFATTLETIHDRFVGMLEAKGLTEEQIGTVMEQATEETILDVVNGREPLEVQLATLEDLEVGEFSGTGEDVFELGAFEDEQLDLLVEMTPGPASAYLKRNEDAFLPDDLASQQPRRVRRPRPPATRKTVIDAGEAKIVVGRKVSGSDKAALEAIGKVIKELLEKSSREEGK